MNRIIKFRAWHKLDSEMGKVEGLDFLYDKAYVLFGNVKSGIHFDLLELMQFTGLLDKTGVVEIYEGDIIDTEGNLIGNIYESPSLHEEGVNHVIEGVGTSAWRNTESIAVGCGCKYAQ